MPVIIKTDEQIDLMKVAAKVLAKTHDLIKEAIHPGITTKELDTIAEEYIRSKDCLPACKGYNGFPATICASVNDQVIHGIPGNYKIKDGDIVSIDITASYKGFHADSARTHACGNVSSEANKLIEVTRGSFFEGIKFAKVGNHLNDISGSIQDYVESNGFSVVRDFVGHGIGKDMHESPDITNYRLPMRGIRLSKGMAIAVEPMVNIGSYEVKILQDGWTVKTKDGSLSAHYENTLIITDGDPDVITLL